jgi:hypothetical protein
MKGLWVAQIESHPRASIARPSPHQISIFSDFFMRLTRSCQRPPETRAQRTELPEIAGQTTQLVRERVGTFPPSAAFLRLLVGHHFEGIEKIGRRPSQVSFARCAMKSSTVRASRFASTIGGRVKAPNSLNSPRYRRILVQGLVYPRFVVIAHVQKEQVAQVPLAKHNDMVKAFPPN